MTKPEHFYLNEMTLAALEHTILETLRHMEPEVALPESEATISVGPMRVGDTVVLTLTVAIHGGASAKPRSQSVKKGGRKP